MSIFISIVSCVCVLVRRHHISIKLYVLDTFLSASSFIRTHKYLWIQGTEPSDIFIWYTRISWSIHLIFFFHLFVFECESTATTVSQQSMWYVNDAKRLWTKATRKYTFRNVRRREYRTEIWYSVRRFRSRWILHCRVDDGSSHRPSRMFARFSSFVELTNACATLQRHSTKSSHLKQTLIERILLGVSKATKKIPFTAHSDAQKTNTS